MPAGVVRALSHTQESLSKNGQNLGILEMNVSHKEWNIDTKQIISLLKMQVNNS